jgi:Helix-turn-helix domain
VAKALPPILGPNEVAALSQATLNFLRQNLGSHLPIPLAQVEETIRLFSLAKRCSSARERKGLTIADVAKELKVPQYRLKAIESCRAAELEPNVLERYIRFLGLNRWYSQWVSANEGTPFRLGRGSGRVKGRSGRTSGWS